MYMNASIPFSCKTIFERGLTEWLVLTVAGSATPCSDTYVEDSDKLSTAGGMAHRMGMDERVKNPAERLVTEQPGTQWKTTKCIDRSERG